MPEPLFKEESYKLIESCMEIHRELGMGFKEIVYKDAIEVELINNKIPFIRERSFKVEYKGVILKHRFSADFIIYDPDYSRSQSFLFHNKQFLRSNNNYLKASGVKLDIIANFGEPSFKYKRVIF